MSTTEQVTPTDAGVHPSAIGTNVRPDTTQQSDPNPSETATIGNENHDEYPEQKHAGKVGYGPQYRPGPTFADKVTGLKEEVKGKITGNQGLVQEGHERRTGELKRKEKEADMNDPFSNQQTEHNVVQEQHPDDSHGAGKK
ncbi:uncharacterized protein EV420DRAFT_1648940 [Desarmillaria tabescens]|uniref:Uncharacterized protein n=1 Tax=Armillaria tabescens TaxID=1929756 RepID=A0AA39JK64_ARMTA|nr:uncharacterized protein EV420DRAFT_1648940 [Desarmillaria tabescens]KAK0444246.1 hypothetical protein EV420DRAFT_1648940 [Desarmillaria tabescens]